MATNPSDMSVALAALRADVVVQGPAGERRLPIADFHRLPGDTPERDTNLAPGELIVAVELPPSPFAARSHYLKVRDRASYAFALVSVAAALDLRDGVVRDAALALGGVAHRPWRVAEAENALVGKPLDDATIARRERPTARRRRAAARQRFQGRAGAPIDRTRIEDRWRTRMITGQGIDRVDGALKVTGRAPFAAEFAAPGLVHAVMVTSTVPSGRIVRMDVAAALALPGVIAVLTPMNAPRLPQKGQGEVNPPAGRVLSLLQDDVVSYNNQPIAVAVADTLERAAQAARLVRVTYAPADAKLDFAAAKARAFAPPKANREPTDHQRGDIVASMAASATTVGAVYTTPIEHHNPMEPHATVAQWSGDKLTLHDATQNVGGVPHGDGARVRRRRPRT